MKKSIDILLSLKELFLRYGRMIRFSHSIFALPFTFAAVLLVTRFYPLTLSKIFWILLAMVSARSAAMGFNRIVDRKIDALNPRTQKRELPQGMISIRDAYLFTFICCSIFIASAFCLNAACGLLSFPALVLFVFYPYTKQWTWTSHFFLGACLGLAPLGAWLAIAGTIHTSILLLGLAVLFWVAGFDIVYSTQDLEFDTQHNLFSIPKRFGLAKALKIAMALHGVSLACLVWVGILFKLNLYYNIACALIALLVLYEHSLVNPRDVSKAQKAFNANGLISILYLIAVWVGR